MSEVYTEATEGALEYGTEYVRADLLPVVKSLVWEDFGDRGSKSYVFGRACYLITRWSTGRFELCESYPGYQGARIGEGFFETIDSAKAAAQADYEARIRASLDMIDPAELVAGAYEAAIRACSEVHTTGRVHGQSGVVAAIRSPPPPLHPSIRKGDRQMTNRPLDFRAPMIRALLDGRKTQDRRVLNPQPEPHATFFAYDLGDNGFFARWLEEDEQGNCDLPFARIPAMKGDRLWVKEAWRTTDGLDKLSGSEIAERCTEAGYKTPWCPLQYEADGAQTNWIASGHGFGTEVGRYRHARFMPCWASRLTLIVTDVRVQRLQEISRGEAMDEGCPFANMADGPNPRDWFRDLWNTLPGPEAWDDNPWVTALTFTVHKRNIDQMEADQ